MTTVATGWLVGRGESAIYAVGPEQEVKVSFAPDQSPSLDLPPLVSELKKLGALVDRPDDEVELPGHSLADAITRGWPNADQAELIWTAEEAMRLPAGMPADERDRALRAFVSGLAPDGRLFAYSRLASGNGEVRGDRPNPRELRELLTALDGADEITGGRFGAEQRPWRVAPAGVELLDCSQAHRLGPLTEVTRAHELSDDGLPGIHMATAQTSELDLANPSDSLARKVQGVGSAADCTLIARAEGAERMAYRASDLTTSSSGIAAHTTFAAACASALAELVERDAFIWTWLQQIGRERISAAGVSSEVLAWRAALADRGWQTHWVNLTLESWPVILCCLVHDELGLQLGAACRQEAAAALRSATLEAAILALRFNPTEYARPEPEQVFQPLDHLLLHRDPRMNEHTAFLYGAAAEIELGEIAGVDDAIAALSELKIDVGFEDLTSARSQPFYVARAVAPGLLPLTFGFRSEPVDLELASLPRRFGDATFGRPLNGSERSLSIPHPFA